jgi:GT2 family glycosyltransferase
VIDNNSQDDSLQLVERFLPQADIIRLPKNTGFAAGHNVGFRRCTTALVAVLNPDVVIDWPGIQRVIAMFAEPAVGAAQGKLYRRDKIFDSAGVVLTAAFNGRERGAGEIDMGQYDETDDIDATTGAFSVYRLAALKRVAFQGEVFDEKFWAYKEDVDLCWRLRRAGWQIRFVPVRAGWHQRSVKSEGPWGWSLQLAGIGRRLRDPRSRLSWRNWLWMMVKNATSREILIHSPAIGWRLIVICSLTLVYWPWLREWVNFWQGLPAMIARRHKYR